MKFTSREFGKRSVTSFPASKWKMKIYRQVKWFRWIGAIVLKYRCHSIWNIQLWEKCVENYVLTHPSATRLHYSDPSADSTGKQKCPFSTNWIMNNDFSRILTWPNFLSHTFFQRNFLFRTQSCVLYYRFYLI